MVTNFRNFTESEIQLCKSTMASGTIRKQAEVKSLDYENQLWMKGILGENNANELRNTVLFLLGINIASRVGNEHYALQRPGGSAGSQILFELNAMGVKCLVYREDSVTKTNRGGLKDMEKKEVSMGQAY